MHSNCMKLGKYRSILDFIFLLSVMFVSSLFKRVFTNVRAFLLVISLTRNTVFFRSLYLVKTFKDQNRSHGML